MLEKRRWIGSLRQLIQVLVHWREETDMLVHAFFEIPNDVSIEIQFRLLNPIRWHMLLEASTSGFMIHPHSSICFQHSVHFVKHLNLLILILVFVQIVAA